MDDEDLLISKPDVYLYEIPSGKDEPNCDHRAADWDIANPTWQGKVLVYMVNTCCHLQLEDLEGNIYGQTVLEEYPGKTLKPVIDSKRYFTLNVKNAEGDFKLVGIGFTNREDSAELSNILKGYFAAAVRRKRKLDQSTSKLSEAPPSKTVKTQVLESIFLQKNDPDYKYIVGNRFQCHECPMNFHCSELMLQHWSTVHNRKNARLCMECKLPYPYKGERNAHSRKFHTKAFPCLVCSASFCTEVEIIEHSLNVHKLGVSAEPTDSTLDKDRTVDPHVESNVAESIFSQTNDPDYDYKEGKRFQCHECPLRFNCPDLMVYHWSKTHNHKKACVCKECKLPFPFRGERNNHFEKFHTKAFPCTLCKIRLDTEQQVVEHLLNEHKLEADGDPDPGVTKINNNSLESIFSQTNDTKYKFKVGDRFQCHECSRNCCRSPFHTEQEIDEHLLNVHQLVAEETPIKIKQTITTEDSGIAQINNNGRNDTSESSDTGIELTFLENSVDPVNNNGVPGILKLMPSRVCKICRDIAETNKERCVHHRFHMQTTEGVKVKTERKFNEVTNEGVKEEPNDVAVDESPNEIVTKYKLNEGASKKTLKDEKNVTKLDHEENPNEVVSEENLNDVANEESLTEVANEEILIVYKEEIVTKVPKEKILTEVANEEIMIVYKEEIVTEFVDK
ncbi:unnamed protein product [Allacma fusca]|uniref:C2H2-type domain-containing protein n=1 Tax=Allacma fusca TaxID=39272 RepID=A0A8J2L6N5_9HEXA|nr:unnamed protein product [Allacma fusca]